ncbi:MAG: hypothetical protein KR126chlam1_00019 [Chlamydiae bacterium]|nr:hypothetical protein [Chlamydiota bacterium]
MAQVSTNEFTPGMKEALTTLIPSAVVSIIKGLQKSPLSLRGLCQYQE